MEHRVCLHSDHTTCIYGRGEENPKKKSRSLFQFVQLEETHQVNEKGELRQIHKNNNFRTLITILYLKGPGPNYIFACV